MFFILALLASSSFSAETTGEVVPISTTAAAEIIAETTETITTQPPPKSCSSVFLNTLCSEATVGSSCAVECLSGEAATYNYVCDETTLEWKPEALGQECTIDVLQWNMRDMYCEKDLLELEPQMSAYQCADLVAANPDCPTEMYVYVPFETCTCIRSTNHCKLKYVEQIEGSFTHSPTHITVNATDMYVPIAHDHTCGEKQDAIHFCKECEWEEIISIEECAGQVMEASVCSSIFSWLDEREPEKNQCWCVPKEKNSCEFEEGHDYITYTLIEHRDLVGDAPTSELKKFTLTMIVVTMVVTPIALCLGWFLHMTTAKSRGKADDFNDILLDNKP